MLNDAKYAIAWDGHAPKGDDVCSTFLRILIEEETSPENRRKMLSDNADAVCSSADSIAIFGSHQTADMAHALWQIRELQVACPSLTSTFDFSRLSGVPEVDDVLFLLAGGSWPTESTSSTSSGSTDRLEKQHRCSLTEGKQFSEVGKQIVEGFTIKQNAKSGCDKFLKDVSESESLDALIKLRKP
jgi:hypothetical protein